MASDAASRPHREQPGDVGAGGAPSPTEQGHDPFEEATRERFGEVSLQRLRKDDGRALILYEQLDRDPS